MSVSFYQRRAWAVALVVASGLVVFLLSYVFQALAWWLPEFFRTAGADLPAPTLYFLDVFAVRSEGYLAHVIRWFWWPMAGALGYCHLRYVDPAEFGRAFLPAFVACWLLIALAISSILLIVAMPFFVLGGTVRKLPAAAEAVEVISLLLPALVLLALGFVWWTGRRATNKT